MQPHEFTDLLAKNIPEPRLSGEIADHESSEAIFLQTMIELFIADKSPPLEAKYAVYFSVREIFVD